MSFTGQYLDHGYKRHDPLHVLLQLGHGAQLQRNHLIVRKSSIVALRTKAYTRYTHSIPSHISQHCFQSFLMFNHEISHTHIYRTNLTLTHNVQLYLVVFGQERQSAVLPGRVTLCHVHRAVRRFARWFVVSLL